jgi:hypothetical protein
VQRCAVRRSLHNGPEALARVAVVCLLTGFADTITVELIMSGTAE